jgi:hypothetical protein
MAHTVKNASDLYESFHRYEPRNIGKFDPSFRIPRKVYKQGRAINVLYRSPKVDPETLSKPKRPVDYIHDHDSRGVVTYLVEGDGEEVATPDWICEAAALTSLGQCLGFAFEDPSGKEVTAKGKTPLPELYTVQVGWPKRAALLVVQDKRDVIAIIWGGKLRVEPRGIVG